MKLRFVMTTLTLLQLSTFNLYAVVGSFGTIAPRYPEPVYTLGSKYEDTMIFFDELTEIIYFQLDNAGSNIVNKLQLDASKIKFNQIAYEFEGKEYQLIPSENNRNAIDDFYQSLENNGKKILTKYAEKNKLDIMMYVTYDSTGLKNAFKRLRAGNQSTKDISFRINTFTYYLQSKVRQPGNIIITVKDVLEYPDFDRNDFQSKLAASFLESFQSAVQMLSISGSIQNNSYPSAKKDIGTKDDVQVASQKAHKELEESDGW